VLAGPDPRSRLTTSCMMSKRLSCPSPSTLLSLLVSGAHANFGTCWLGVTCATELECRAPLPITNARPQPVGARCLALAPFALQTQPTHAPSRYHELTMPALNQSSADGASASTPAWGSHVTSRTLHNSPSISGVHLRPSSVPVIPLQNHGHRTRRVPGPLAFLETDTPRARHNVAGHTPDPEASQ